MKHILTIGRHLGRASRALLVAASSCGIAALALALGASPASAQAWHQHFYWDTPESIPISGRPVPEFAWLDAEMRDFMRARSIPGGVMGLMRNGEVVYLRGFGHDYNKNPLPENTPFCLASVSKTITTAAAKHLIASGALSLNDFVFDRGQQVLIGGFNVTIGGILPSPTYAPFPDLASADPGVADIRVRHLILHQSGWYASNPPYVEDYAFHDIDCAEEMGIASPPGVANKIRWIQGKPLRFQPGTDSKYSNINSLILGAVIEHVSGTSLDTYVRTHIMRPELWIPSTEVFRGRTFRGQQSPREPYYKTLNDHPDSATGPLLTQNVFDPQGPLVERAYGGDHVEATLAFGGFVASPEAMLRFAWHYDVRGDSAAFGEPHSGDVPTGGFAGSLPGFETIIQQRNQPGVGNLRFFLAFNQRTNDDDFYDGHWPTDFWESINTDLWSPSQVYPTTTSGGFWTQVGTEAHTGVGGFNTPFSGFQRMLNRTTTGSIVRLLPGQQPWTGVLDRQMLIDAPLGMVTLGQ